MDNLNTVDIGKILFSRCLEAGHWPDKIQFTKYLYLLDYCHWRFHGKQATAINWKFFHYGPWSQDASIAMNGVQDHFRVGWRDFREDDEREFYGFDRIKEKVEFHKRMPLPEIGLKSNEDLIVSKVKLRPALLIHCDPVNLRKQANHFAGILPKAPNPSYYVFAPIYSLRKSEVDHGFPEAFIEAVKNDEFPNMLYLPAFRTELPNDSVAVLNDPFAAGINAIEETTLQLDPLELASKLEEFGEHVQGEILLQAEEAGSAV